MTTLRTPTSMEDFIAQLADADIQGEDMDELVHETAASAAASINNSGTTAQVEFLLKNGWSFEDIFREATHVHEGGLTGIMDDDLPQTRCLEDLRVASDGGVDDATAENEEDEQ